MSYLRNILIAVTQAGNALLGGYPDESTSARAYRLRHKRGWRVVYLAINELFFWQPDHCAAAYRAERERRHLPPELRDA